MDIQLEKNLWAFLDLNLESFLNLGVSNIQLNVFRI